MEDAQGLDPKILSDIVQLKMPYGKYSGKLLCDIPVSYLEWMSMKGAFPKGTLGMQLRTVYEIKINGLDHIFTEQKIKLS